MSNDNKKIAIIGAGFVGSTAAYALLIDGLAEEIAIIDVNKEKAKGEALDLVQGNLFTSYTSIKFGSSYRLCKDADIVVITAGAHQKPGETRLDLTKKNAMILKGIINNIIKYNRSCIILMVSNPLDVLTYLALKWSRFPKHRVLGTGTMLDTARFRYNLSQYYKVNPVSVHAYILGEHGDSEFPVWSSANIGGVHLRDFRDYNKTKLNEIYLKTKNSAYEIINTKGATYYAIGLAITKVVKTILTDQSGVLPVSSYIDNYYGVKDVCLSTPAVLNRRGVKERICLKLNDEEKKLLRKSAATIKKYIRSVS